MSNIRGLAGRLLPIVALIGLGAMAWPAPAQAWWRGGFAVGIAPPLFYAPPPVYYAPPPVYYAPPPVVYAPPPAYAPPAYAADGYAPAAANGAGCYAGAYVCPLARATPVGANCSCPAEGGRVYGSVH